MKLAPVSGLSLGVATALACVATALACVSTDPPPVIVASTLEAEEDCIQHLDAGPAREACRAKARAAVCAYWDADVNCRGDR